MAKVALVQMTSSAQIEENLEQIERFVRLARDAGSDLVVLPENFAFMGLKESDKLEVAEVEGQGAIQKKISFLAKQMGIWIISGTILLKSQGVKVRASCLVYDGQGRQVARYDKIHLFDVRVSEQEAHQESAMVEPGNQLVLVDTPIGKVGLTVCYDLRFPELYHQLQRKGAEIFTVPSAFTEVTGLAHWDVLLRARAIENLSYVLAPNQFGHHENGRDTYGHSMVVSPWGVILAERDWDAGILVAEIDLDHLKQLRHQFPSINHHVL